jgi:hypothetical protein
VSQSLVADRTGPSGVTDLDSLRNRMTDPFRLRPDLRFMRALDLVDAMLGAPDSVAAGWAFSDGRWRITCDGRDVGTLSEMPDYAELDSLLLEWARVRLAERRNAVGASPARSAKADASLQKLDALWAVRDVDQHWRAGEHGVGLLGQAADGLTWLALETVDRVGAGDPVTARAFAAVALGRAAGLDLDRDRALLAKTMGYGAAARTLARALPARDAVRLFVEGDGNGLRAAADAPKATDRDQYLYIAHLGLMSDYKEYERRSQQRMALGGVRLLAVASTGLNIERFEAHEPTAAAVLVALAEGLDAAGLSKVVPRGDGGNLGQVIQVFEQAMNRLPDDGGPFFDRELFQSFYRSLFYSALDRLGSHDLDELSSVEASKNMSDELDRDGDTAGGAFQRAFAHLVASKSGKPDLDRLESDLDPDGVFGAPLHIRAMDEIVEHLVSGEPRGSADVRRLATALDTRPDSRWRYGWFVAQFAQVLTLADRLRASAAAATGMDAPQALAWRAMFEEDPATTKELIGARMSPSQRAAVLGYAARTKDVAWDTVDRAYQRQIAETPDDFTIAFQFANALEDRGEYTRARGVMQAWQKRGVGGGLQPTLAGTAIARLYQKEGRAAEAREAIGRLEESGQLGAMSRKASLLFADGQKDAALKLAFAVWTRYPDVPEGRMMLVELLWRSDRHADAASVLTQERYPLAGRAWIENVAPTFLEVFGDRPDAAIRAIEPIAARGPKAAEWIGYLADAAARDKKPRIAFELESRCRTSGMEEWETVAAAYAYLEAWKGEAPALAWVQKRVPEDARPIVQMFAHSYDAGELTWTLESTPRDDATRDYLWLLRALAIARDPALASKRAEALSYFRATTSKSYYVTAARYLLGQADLKDVLALGNTPKRRCELYYYIGARAEAEGRLADAADWYGMSVTTGLSHNAEWRWASARLFAWLAQERRLDRLATKPAGSS